MRLARTITAITASALLSISFAGAVAGQSDDDVMSSTDETGMEMALEPGVANLRLVDSTGSGDALLSASSPAAAAVEMRLATVADDGSVASVPVDTIAIPASGDIVLQPGGYHLVLVDPVEPLAEGDEIELTLVLEKAGSVTIATPILLIDLSAVTVEPVVTEPPATADLPTSFTVEAMDNFFVPDTLEAPANTEIKVTLLNYGFLPHNIAFYTDDSATQLLADGALTSVIDPEFEAIARFTTPGPGEYFILCVIHPEMTGTLIVR